MALVSLYAGMLVGAHLMVGLLCLWFMVKKDAG